MITIARLFILFSFLIVQCYGQQRLSRHNYWINIEDDTRFLNQRGKINHILLDTGEKIKRLQIPDRCLDGNPSNNYSFTYISWQRPTSQSNITIVSDINTLPYGVTVDSYLKKQFLSMHNNLSILVGSSNSLILLCNTTAKIILFTNFSAYFHHDKHNGCNITTPVTLVCQFPKRISADISTRLPSNAFPGIISLYEPLPTGLRKLDFTRHYNYLKKTYTLILVSNITDMRDLCLTWSMYISNIQGLPASVNIRSYMLETPLICYKYNLTSHIYTKFTYGTNHTKLETTYSPAFQTPLNDSPSKYNSLYLTDTKFTYGTTHIGIETTDIPAFEIPSNKSELFTYKTFIIIIAAVSLLIASIGIISWCSRKHVVGLFR